MKYLMDLERTIGSGIATYWKPNKFGYTSDIEAAGLYEDSAAREIAEDDFDNQTVIIDEKTVKNIIRR